MANEVKYGDLIYLEINNQENKVNQSSLIINSNGFLDSNLFAASKKSFSELQSSFMNSVFIILPALMDTQDDLKLINSLEDDLKLKEIEEDLKLKKINEDLNLKLAEDLKLKRIEEALKLERIEEALKLPGTECFLKAAANQFLKNNITQKKNAIKNKQKSYKLLNEKILLEVNGKNVKFGERILLQHYLSGQYIKAHTSAHELHKHLLSISLTKNRNEDCYFKVSPAFSAQGQDSIRFEMDIQLISYKNSTVISISDEPCNLLIQDVLTNDDIENSDKFFPLDSYRRDDPITTFDQSKFVVGCSLEEEKASKIKFLKYCSKEKLDRQDEEKILKNGDYLRLQIGDSYLTLNKGAYKSTYGFMSQANNDYKLNTLNTVFQIIEESKIADAIYPQGDEIRINPPIASNNTDYKEIYLKHFSTGLLFQFTDENGLSHPNLNENCKMQLISNNYSTDEPTPLLKNALVSIKKYDKITKKDVYLAEGAIESVKIIQQDMNTLYFVGMRSTEEHIKLLAKQIRKNPQSNDINGSYFRVTKVEHQEIQDIHFCESYANSLKQFLRLIIGYKRGSEKVTIPVLNSQIIKTIENSNSFCRYLIKNPIKNDTELEKLSYPEIVPSLVFQILSREFKIFDAINRIIYYLVVDKEFVIRNEEKSQITNLSTSKKLMYFGDQINIDAICDLIRSLIRIIFAGTKANSINKRYNSQYIRVYIHSLLNLNGVFNPKWSSTNEHRNLMRSEFVQILYDVLWDGDLDSFGQLIFYENRLFENIRNQTDFELHYINILNHYCKSNSPALENILRHNFIYDFLSDDQKRENFLPTFDQTRYVAELKRNDKTYTINLDDKLNDKIEYIVGILNLLNTLSKTNSAKLSYLVMKTYPYTLCDAIIKNTSVHIKLRDRLRSLSKNIHLRYVKLPILKVPSNIKFIFKDHETYETKSYTLLKEAQKVFLHEQEIQFFKNNGIDILELRNNIILKTNHSDNQNLHSDDMDNSQNRINLEDDNKNNITVIKDEPIDFTISNDSVHAAYQFHEIANILRFDSYLSPDKLLKIHQNMWSFLSTVNNNIKERIEKEEQNEQEENSNNVNVTIEEHIFNENFEKIFDIIDFLDYQIVELAMLQSIGEIRDSILSKAPVTFGFALNQAKKIVPGKNLTERLTRNLTEIAANDNNYSQFEQIIINNIIEVISEEWKTKRRLYTIAGKDHLLKEEKKSNTSKKKIEDKNTIQNDKSKLSEQPFLEEKILLIISELIERGDIRIATTAIQTLKRKSKFEKKIFREIKRWAILNSPKDGDNFLLLITSLIEIESLSRRIKIVNEFDLPKIDDTKENIISKLLEYLENLISVLYDVQTHINFYDENNPTITNPAEARKIFFDRLCQSKLPKNQEIPFKWKESLVRHNYQRVMRVVNAQEILVPLIKTFVTGDAFDLDSIKPYSEPESSDNSNDIKASKNEEDKENGEEEEEEEKKVKLPPVFILIYRYIMIIISLYVDCNDQNQILISNCNPFILFYYEDEYINSSVECLMMFSQTIRKNKKLLKMDQQYLIDITIYNFFDYLNDFDVNANIDSTVAVNHMRYLEFLYTSKIPRDYFDPPEVFSKIFNQFFKYLMDNNDVISLLKIFCNDNIENNDNEIATTKKTNNNISIYKPPIFHLLLKEYLHFLYHLTLKKNKDDIITLQNQISAKKIFDVLITPNLHVNFEIKGNLMKIVAGLNYGEYRKANVFNNDEEFCNFMAIILIDIAAFINYNMDNNIEEEMRLDDILNTFIGKSFIAKDLIKSYKTLFEFLKNKNAQNIKLEEYQDQIPLKTIWKSYIFKSLTYVVSQIISYEHQKFLFVYPNKDLKNIMEIWLKYIRILLKSYSDDMHFLSSIIELMKKLCLLNEYSAYKNSFNLIKQGIYDLKKMDGEINLALPTEPEQVLEAPQYIVNSPTKQFDLMKKQTNLHYHDHPIGNNQGEDYNQMNIGDIISEHVKKWAKRKNDYLERNLHLLASALSKHNGCIKQLIYFISRDVKDVSLRDIIFALRLLRKIIEVHNENPEDISKQIYTWTDITAVNLSRIRRAQNLLLSLNIIPALFNLLVSGARGSSKLFMEILLLLISLLYGGNDECQTRFYKQIRTDVENKIVQYLAKTIDASIELIFKFDTKRNVQVYMEAQNFVYENLNNIPTQEKDELKKILKEKLSLHFTNLMKKRYPIPSEITKAQEYCIIIITFLQALCEGHFTEFQEFLRSQPLVKNEKKEHPSSFNFLEYFRNCYGGWLKVMNIHNVYLGEKILDLLIEILEGESDEIFNSFLEKTTLIDLSQTLNYYDNEFDLFSRGFGSETNHKNYQNIKSKDLVILQNLVERASPLAKKVITSSIKIETILAFLIQNMTNFAQKKGKSPEFPGKSDLENDEFNENPFLSDGLACFIILKGLWDNELERKFPKLLEKMKKAKLISMEDNKLIDNDEFMQNMLNFCNRYTSSVEIYRKKKNQTYRIYFPKYVVMEYLRDNIKQDFEYNVDRSNTQTKIEDFMSTIEEFRSQSYIEYESRKRLFGLNVNILYWLFSIISNVLTLAANLANLFTLEVKSTYEVRVPDETQKIIHVLSSLNSGAAGCLILLWFYCQLDSYLTTRWEKFVEYNHIHLSDEIPGDFEVSLLEYTQDNPPPKHIAELILKMKAPFTSIWKLATKSAQNFYSKRTLWFLLTCPTLQWRFIFLALCIGSNFHPIVGGFQFIDIILRSDTVQKIWEKLKTNSSNYFWSIILLFTIVFIYSLISLYYLQDLFKISNTETHCEDSYSCFLFNFNTGLRAGGGIGDEVQQPSYNPNDKGLYFAYTLYEFSFYVICIIITLHLIFGMIIDSLGDIRDERNQREEDKKNICFICGLERSEIERYFSFDDHQNLEHNKWNYLAYLIFLKAKQDFAPNDFTEMETYVLDRFERKNFEWVPVGKSLTLERILEKESRNRKSELEQFQEEIQTKMDDVLTNKKDIQDGAKELKELVHRYYTTSKQRLSFNEKNMEGVEKSAKPKKTDDPSKVKDSQPKMMMKSNMNNKN